jgi:hypothetical protein
VKIKLLILFVACACLPRLGFAQTTPPKTDTAGGLVILCIEPSSTSLAGAKADLTVKPLTRQGDNFIGDYQLKVMPYFFKSETGKLSILLSEKLLRQIIGGKPVKFSGFAKTNGDTKTKPINGTVTPSANDCGCVTFSVKTKNGALVFTSPYRIADQ